MNRQVLPSMVLSVLIVCFFAVVLFPLERERDRRPKDELADPPIASQALASAPTTPPEVPTDVTSAPPPPTPAAPTPAPKLEPEPAVPVAARPRSEDTPAVVDASPVEEVHKPVLASAPSAVPSASSTVPEAPAPQVSAFTPVSSPAPAPAPPKAVVKEAPQVVVAREPEKAKEKAPDPISTERPPSSEMVTIPRSDTEVTIVDSGETLDDVAIRVYGSRSGVETLLRANREVLTRRSGPLKPGLQLWTPER